MVKFKILANDKIAGLRRLGIGVYETYNTVEISILRSSSVAIELPEIKTDPVIEENIKIEEEVNPVGKYNNRTRPTDMPKHKRV
jgi:hypothetical protein